MPHPASSAPAPSPNPDTLSESRWLGRWFTAARRQGLLSLLPPEAWHTLSALLSFTSRDGTRRFTVDYLALALGQRREGALQRLHGLTDLQWQGQPLARLEYDPEGEITGVSLAPLEVLVRIDPAEGDHEPTATRKAASDPTTLVLQADLETAGLRPEQVEWVLGHFPPDRIRRQLDWLPARQARNPAALLLRAIESDWGAPREAA